MGVTIHSFADLVDADAAGGAHGAAAMTNRFMYKIVALVFSSFREVLLMDSDNIVLSDPSSLFASELYESRGSILWMDFWRGSAAPDLASVLGAGAAANHTHESGQMVMDKKRTWEALRLALFFNAHADVFYPLTVNYMGLGDKEIVSTAFLHLRTPYGVAPHGPDHVGVRDHDRAETLGNTMMQHDMDGTPMFLHANLGKPMGFVPADASAYVRRWQISNGRGLDLPRALNDAADTEDFEMWYYDLLRRRRCWFDGRPAKHWYHTLGFGPFVEGFHVSDHYNVNDALESFRGMVDAGIVFG
jgi:alpha 1,2-mannosyltransferase